MGILDQQMAGPPASAAPAAPEAPAASTPGKLTLTPEAIQAKLNLDAKQKPMLQRIVVAGMKVMFDPKTHQLMLDSLNGPGPLGQKLGQGIAGLMGVLVRESQGSMPPDLLIPAGLVLMGHAADFMAKAGMPVTDQDVGQGMEVMIDTVLRANKIDPARVDAIGGDVLAQAGAEPASSETEAGA